MNRFVLKYPLLFAIGWTVVIFVLCCTPGKYVPSAHWLDLLSFDKLVHASIFFVLASLWFLYFIKIRSVTPSRIAFVLLGCVAYGGILEIMQATVFSQRSGDWLDFTANSIGCLAAFILFKRKKQFLLPNT